MRLIFWDTELLKSIEENGGWEGAYNGNCGLSCIALYDSADGRYHIYDQKNLDTAVEHLNEADLLIGFNSVKFDTVVTQAVTGRYITVQQYDLLQAIYDAIGYKVKGWKLDQVAQRTIGSGKTETGAFATQLAADGEWGRLFTYCMHDVQLVRDLWNHLVDGLPLIAPDESELHLTLPAEEYA